ncbi:MAG TPA: metalloregulator ArsR/SmtB family transcription factor [Longimicrobiales bacterium]|nr:metalloregulator ArsR/SmtB family transcription factor [Longimicrobiales bacterium]
MTTTATTSARLATPLQRIKALADEKRLRILLLLARGEQCVCDLTDALDAGQSLLSFHLRTLKDAGLVTGRREGRWAYYAISTAGLSELEAFLRSIREEAALPKAQQARPSCDTR